ncbi:hypothetical protein [Pedobacter duraquae]|uniref:DUF4062 domain-containing protein n=1 Tax=Pedobacter duraquae TaxID=425511 RepID=A0A4R6ID74_9SPHI|nr:hypothetical protein [Pedobacter duraquae]TDO20230.1 hypothetical protein CLV32_3990 [Pedobacter duraquae]
MLSPSVMFCGAADTQCYLEDYFNACRSLNLQKPVTFINGIFFFDQFGGPKAHKFSSQLTIDASDLIIFVIKSTYADITWEEEFEYASEQGKNLIILCYQPTYDVYRGATTYQVRESTLFAKMAYLETCNRYNQMGIIGYQDFGLEQAIINQISALFASALKNNQSYNKRQSFINNQLYGKKYKEYKKHPITNKNVELCRQILFDPYENKETRKRALQYFMYSKSLIIDGASEQEQFKTLLEECLDKDVSKRAWKEVTKTLFPELNG